MQEWDDDDVEDEDWHEDTYEWKKRKLEEKTKTMGLGDDSEDPATVHKKMRMGLNNPMQVMMNCMNSYPLHPYSPSSLRPSRHKALFLTVIPSSWALWS